MFTLKKRGAKNKVQGTLNNDKLYKYYRSKAKNPVHRSTFRNVIKDLNILIKDRILDAEDFKMPYRLGILRINKFRQNLFQRKKEDWPVDYEKSKELGFLVYFEHDYVYCWKWDKRKAVVKNMTLYKFHPSRHNKRALAHAIKHLKKDYFTKNARKISIS